jgi:hypothetical protein
MARVIVANSSSISNTGCQIDHVADYLLDSNLLHTIASVRIARNRQQDDGVLYGAVPEGA